MTAHIAGRLVLPDRVVAGRITLENGRIASIEPRSADSRGPYIAPGFIDAHVHGWGGHDAMGSPDDLHGMAPQGVPASPPTAASPPGGRRAASPAPARSSPGATAEGADAAEPLGVHL